MERSRKRESRRGRGVFPKEEMGLFLAFLPKNRVSISTQKTPSKSDPKNAIADSASANSASAYPTNPSSDHPVQLPPTFWRKGRFSLAVQGYYRVPLRRATAFARENTPRVEAGRSEAGRRGRRRGGGLVRLPTEWHLNTILNPSTRPDMNPKLLGPKPTRYSLHPTPCILDPPPWTLYPRPYTLNTRLYN